MRAIVFRFASKNDDKIVHHELPKGANFRATQTA